MTRLKVLGAMLGAAALTAVGSGAAFAGEVNGNGDELPLQGASICKYSGLNDEINADEPTRTQSYGTFLQYFGKQAAEGMGLTPGAGIALLKGQLPSPGVACNPTAGFEE